MRMLIIAAALLAGCTPAPPQYGGMTEIGVTGMAVRLGCPFENVRIQNMQKGWTAATWDAVCVAPAKTLACQVEANGTTICHPK